MGLDQYLSKRIYIGANYEHNDVKGEINLTKEGKPVKVTLNKVTEITERVMQWRKANAIHQWFVNTVQEGEDDCREAYVDREQLQELVNLCKEVLADHSKAEELLPTTEGFFFGNTDYDEWYFGDLKETVEELEKELSEESEGYYYYSSSW